jgi:CBS domain containing-hemolysin-like protein
LIKLEVSSSNLWITFIFTPIVVIFAELIPKTIGRFFREDFSCQVSGFINFFEKLFLPVVEVIEFLSKFLVKLFLKQAKHRSPFVTKEEIRSLVREIEEQGGIDKGEKEAIEEVFDFRSDRVKDVCVELRKVAAFNYTDSRSQILEKTARYRFTRYPVFKEKKIIGYINIFDLFYNSSSAWQDFIRPITKVGFNQKLYGVFTILQAKKESIALVIKGKRIYGIVTVQDLTAEIVTAIVKV